MVRLLALVLVLSTGAARADPQSLADALVAQGVPAAGVGLYAGGRTECAVAGVRALGRDTPVEVDDLWHIGSLTKSMTATLAARLVVRGRIRWDSTVGEVFGSGLPGLDPRAREITLIQLLSHRAGLPQNISAAEIAGLILRHRRASIRTQRLAFANAALSHPPRTRPGSAFAYSNAGYIVAGAMLEAVTGESWERLMAREVFRPLGLTSAGFGPPGTRGRLDQPRGHRVRLTGGLRAIEPGPTADNPPAAGPAGTVHMSLCDLVRYGAAHARMPRDYLPASAWAVLHRSQGDRYALGWVSRRGRLWHDGSNTMWYAQIAVWTDRGRAAVVVTNDGREAELTGPVLQILEALGR